MKPYPEMIFKDQVFYPGDLCTVKAVENQDFYFNYSTIQITDKIIANDVAHKLNGTRMILSTGVHGTNKVLKNCIFIGMAPLKSYVMPLGFEEIPIFVWDSKTIGLSNFLALHIVKI